MLIPTSTWTVLKDLVKKKCFYSSVKNGTTGDNSKKLDGHMSNEDCLTCNKTWNKFSMKNMGDYHDHYLKKDVLLLADVFEKFIILASNFTNLILVIILVLLD